MFKPVALGMCLLWAVTEDGRILIGLEVVCLKNSVNTHFPRMRGVPLEAMVDSLGHPLLVAGGAARIAGELSLDDDGRSMDWTITNKSGRYGFGPSREERHLDNVASAFLEAGVIVKPYYIQGS
jgi:hypothetical protein